MKKITVVALASSLCLFSVPPRIFAGDNHFISSPSFKALSKKMDSTIPGKLVDYDTAGLSLVIFDLETDEFGEIKRDDLGQPIFRNYLAKGYGKAKVEEIDNGSSIQEDWIDVDVDKTVFQVASISKPVAALGLLELLRDLYNNHGGLPVEEVLDAPVNDILSTWELPNVRSSFRSIDAKHVTLNRLMHHTSKIGFEYTPIDNGYIGWWQKRDRLYDDDDSNDYFNIPDTNKALSRNVYRTAGFSAQPWGMSNAVCIKSRPKDHLVEEQYDWELLQFIKDNIDAILSYHYSGGNYLIIQKVIEDLTADRIVPDKGNFYYRNFEKTKSVFAEYMNREILWPLGMTNSTFVYSNQFLNKETKQRFLATGFKKIEWEQSTKKKASSDSLLDSPRSYIAHGNYLYAAKAAAGLYATAPDYAKFLVKLMEKFPENTEINMDYQYVDWIWNPKSLTRIGGKTKFLSDHLGLFPLLDFKKMSHFDPFYHEGSNQGWRSYFLMDPKLKSGIVVLTNTGDMFIGNQGEKVCREVIMTYFEYYQQLAVERRLHETH